MPNLYKGPDRSKKGMYNFLCEGCPSTLAQDLFFQNKYEDAFATVEPYASKSIYHQHAVTSLRVLNARVNNYLPRDTLEKFRSSQINFENFSDLTRRLDPGHLRNVTKHSKKPIMCPICRRFRKKFF